MTIRAEPPEPIPGLEDVSPAALSRLESGVRRTLAELHKQGHVGEVDAGRTALAIELAKVIDHKARSGRASTLGNDARVLMEILDNLVGEASDVDDDLAAAMAEWADSS